MQSIPWKRTDSFVANNTYVDAALAAIDITNITITSKVRDADGALVANLTVEKITPADGTYKLTADSSGWPAGTIYMDIKYVDDDGLVTHSETVAIVVEGEQT